MWKTKSIQRTVFEGTRGRRSSLSLCWSWIKYWKCWYLFGSLCYGQDSLVDFRLEWSWFHQKFRENNRLQWTWSERNFFTSSRLHSLGHWKIHLWSQITRSWDWNTETCKTPFQVQGNINLQRFNYLFCRWRLCGMGSAVLYWELERLRNINWELNLRKSHPTHENWETIQSFLEKKGDQEG